MRIRAKFNELIAWCKRQVYHFVFVSSLTALVLLVAWWAVFLYRSVDQEYEYKLASISQGVSSYMLFLGHNMRQPPQLGIYSKDRRLEIVASDRQPMAESVELIPFWRGYWLQPRKEVLNELEARHRSHRFMIIGESGLLVLLILMSGLIIYRMYWLEKRTTQELHELWSRVSHEIKTPITGLKAFLETLQSGNLTQEEIGPLVELALKQVDRQQQLAENMLVGQKLKRRGAGIKISRLSLSQFLKAYLAKHPHVLVGGNIALHIAENQEENPFHVSADPEAIRIIFDNLIDNAVKYGGKNVSISIHIGQIDKKVQVIIEDNGIGFDPALKENIFKAYKRLGNELPGTQHGTGMGLYICRRLAQKMGGNLTAISEGKGKGARFTLTLLTENKTNQ